MLMCSTCILRFSGLSKTWGLSQKASQSLVSQRLRRSHYNCKKLFSVSSAKRCEEKNKSDIPSSLSNYEIFSEESVPVILDVEEERQKKALSKAQPDKMLGVKLERASTGVFDVEEIVELLRREQGEDIFVVRIPEEYNYANYMVIVSGRSTRHMVAIAEFIRRVYKMKVNSKGHIPKLEGKNSSSWMAIDFGNIVLHVFSKKERKIYDLETLWSVGKEYDTLSHQKTDYLLADYEKILATLSPNT